MQGWTRKDSKAREGAQAIPEVEEHISVSKRRVSTGKVRIRTSVKSFERVAKSVLESDCVEVERVPVNKVVTQPPQVRVEGDVTIVPVTEEVLVATKELLLKEELRIRRRTERRSVERPVTLRRQTVQIERLDSQGNPLPNEE
jgi:uncharacterized protein (TIGR02271 family)